jgi:hypothetical protein
MLTIAEREGRMADNDFFKRNDPESVFLTCMVWAVGGGLVLIYQAASKFFAG